MTPFATSPALLPHTIPDECAVLSAAEMYAADKAAGVDTLTLMEAAGLSVTRVIEARWPRCAVAVLCGPGNNGGDGFVVARRLAEKGWPVQVGLLGPPEALKGDAAANARRWRDFGEIRPLACDLLDGTPLVVDALFGAGLSRALEGRAREIVTAINGRALTCIAIDVPSGVHGDTGEVLDGVAPRCAATVTFFRAKPAHFLYPARDLCGELTVAGIGIPDAVLKDIAPRTAHNVPALWHLPRWTWSDHKYDHGDAVVIGGDLVTGAARLAARAARRAGAGLLRLAVPASAVALYASAEPGAFVQAMDTPAELDELLADKRRNGVLIGPGAGVGAATRARVLRILESGKAVVLDADALTSFEDTPQALLTAIGRAKGPVVLTPHEGEFGRIFKVPAGSRLARARAAAAVSGAVVILKGPDSVVAAPDGRASIASNAPPWLATGGSGDVLAGLVLGLLVQGMGGWQAANAAVWLHGEAGRRLGRGLIAEDLPDALPGVLAGF
ncbi:MAG: NAD(P)H-hydrate dehydratase [Proteobacteria bacterium]|nr:NAD(P)H-hydrate dehydratase [Pseudomonadota bacterium]